MLLLHVPLEHRVVVVSVRSFLPLPLEQLASTTHRGPFVLVAHCWPSVSRVHDSDSDPELPSAQLPPAHTRCVTVLLRVPSSPHVPEKPAQDPQLPVVVPHDFPLVSRAHDWVSVSMGLPLTHDPPEQICGLTLRLCVPVLPQGSVNPLHVLHCGSATLAPQVSPFWFREHVPCSCEVTFTHAPDLQVG